MLRRLMHENRDFVKEAGPLYSKTWQNGPFCHIWADFELNFSELVWADYWELIGKRRRKMKFSMHTVQIRRVLEAAIWYLASEVTTRLSIFGIFSSDKKYYNSLVKSSFLVEYRGPASLSAPNRFVAFQWSIESSSGIGKVAVVAHLSRYDRNISSVCSFGMYNIKNASAREARASKGYSSVGMCHRAEAGSTTKS